eukprot:7447640-Heterocapsa_arctica.AAC.1
MSPSQVRSGQKAWRQTAHLHVQKHMLLRWFALAAGMLLYTHPDGMGMGKHAKHYGTTDLPRMIRKGPH